MQCVCAKDIKAISPEKNCIGKSRNLNLKALRGRIKLGGRTMNPLFGEMNF